MLETCLYAVDLDAAERFYVDVIGLEPFARVARRHVFFRCGAGVFLVFNPETTAHAPGAAAGGSHPERSEARVPPHGARGAGHVAFAVPEAELDAWRARLTERGVPVEAEIRWPRGGRSLYVRDPAGNSVELATPAVWKIQEPGTAEPKTADSDPADSYTADSDTAGP